MAHDASRSVGSMVDKDLSHLADLHLAKMADYPDKLTSPAKLKPTDALKFEDIMGRDTSHWWQLYIDPKNWSEAEERSENPGFYYDADRSPGFQASMINAYKTLLLSNAAEAKELQTTLSSKSKPLTWQAYEKLWEAAIPSSSKQEAGEAAGKYRPNQFTSNFGDQRPTTAFGCPEHLATDVTTERIKDWYLMAEAGQANEMRAYSTRARADKTHFLPMANGDRLQKGVDFVFQRFSTEVTASRTRLAQLEAIARAVRALHIMHTFTDACGRTNVFLLLPAMLLRFGFGLSLGGGLFGESELSFPPDTMFSLFNGGFSIDTIAKVLFVLQDHGLMEKGATAVYDWKPLPTIPVHRPRRISLIPPSSSHESGASNVHKPQLPAHGSASGHIHSDAPDVPSGPSNTTPNASHGSKSGTSSSHSGHPGAPVTSHITHTNTGAGPHTAPHPDTKDPPPRPHGGTNSSGKAPNAGPSPPKSDDRDKSLQTAANHTHTATKPSNGTHTNAPAGTNVSAHKIGVTANEPAHSNNKPAVVPHTEKHVVRAAPMVSTMAVRRTRDVVTGNVQASKTAKLFASTPVTAPPPAGDASTSLTTSPPQTISHQVTNLVLF